MSLRRQVLIWALLAAAVGVPLVLAGFSPYLQWRSPVYIAAGFAGITGLALMLVQPLAIGGYLPVEAGTGRRLHRWVGAALVVAVVLHVAGLWVTSPPDVVDVLLVRSPTPFSIWGLAAMWAVFGAALLVAFRRRIGLRRFRLGHTGLVLVIVVGTILHAVLIEGTMEVVSKWALCALVLIATVRTVLARRVWAVWGR